MPAQHFGIVEDLHGELARRREDQRADARLCCARRRGILQQALEQRDQERGGLAGAGLCLACNILARERNRQSTRLYGSGADETGVAMPCATCGNEVERCEFELGKVCLCH